MTRSALMRKVRLLSKPPEGAILIETVPADQPLPDLARQGRDPSATYEYRTSNGALSYLIARHDTAKGKELRPATLWQMPNGALEWCCKAVPEQRVLYRLPDLGSAPEKPVLISEGEKCADAVGAFSAFCSVTWSGGSNALSRTDFGPLAGRDVIILPDHDEAGANAVLKLSEILRKAGANSIRHVDISKLAEACGVEATSGFDIADAIDAGLSDEQFAYHLSTSDAFAEINKTPDVAQSARGASEDAVQLEILEHYEQSLDSIPPMFELSEHGLIKHDIDGRGNPVDVYAGSPILILGRTKGCEKATGWGYVVAIRSPDAKWTSLVIPARLLAGDGREVREMLADAGAVVPQTRLGRQAQAEYIGYAQTRHIMQLATRPGWNGTGFALPSGNILPEGSGEKLLLDMGERQHFLRKGGTMSGWQELAKLAEGNSRATVALGAAFVGPMLHVLGCQGAGLHFFGKSSRGKTTLLTLAGSVWGGGGKNGFARNWRMTSNGAEGLIADHNDMLLCLDELTMTSAEQALELYYMLSDGHGKARARRDGSTQAVLQSRLMVLSSGENSAADQLGRGATRKHMTGGASVRMLDVPIECVPGQSFEELHGFASEGALAEQMSSLSQTHYGHAGEAFVRYFIDRQDTLRTYAARYLETFIDGYAVEGDDPQVRRVSAHFARIAAAGQLACRAGILPWREDAAAKASYTCLQAWRNHRGSGASQEEQAALSHLQGFFEAHGRARFELISKGKQAEHARSSEFAVRDRCGYRVEDGQGSPIYYVLPEAFKREVCGPHSPDLVIEIAKARNAIELGDGGHRQKKVRFPDYPNGTRVYALRPDMLN